MSVELWFVREVKKVEVAEAEAFFNEGFGKRRRENFVAKFEFVPGEALEFFDGGFEVGGDAEGGLFEDLELE